MMSVDGTVRRVAQRMRECGDAGQWVEEARRKVRLALKEEGIDSFIVDNTVYAFTLKAPAVTNAIEQAGLAGTFTVVGVKTSSGVPERPVDFHEIRQGALNRAFGALEGLVEVEPLPRFALGIENGLIDIGAAGPYVDLAVVALLERSASRPEMLSKAVFTTSTGVPCHPKYVRRSFDTGRAKTAGHFIAEEMGCDDTDWHSHLSGGRLSRSTILDQAVLAALAFKFQKS